MESILKVDYCSFKAAYYACTHWHYSKSMPVGKLVKIGAWENKIFKGAVIFGYGANKSIASPYNLTQTEVCELVRVALSEHQTPVTRIVSIALKMLKKVRLVVSYADKDQGHSGGIYKGGNWVYEGLFNEGTRSAFMVKGRKMHPKSIHSKYGTGTQRLSWLKENIDPDASEYFTKGKHKYLYVLDDTIRDDILKRAKPYERVSSVVVARQASSL